MPINAKQLGSLKINAMRMYHHSSAMPPSSVSLSGTEINGENETTLHKIAEDITNKKNSLELGFLLFNVNHVNSTANLTLQEELIFVEACRQRESNPYSGANPSCLSKKK